MRSEAGITRHDSTQHTQNEISITSDSVKRLRMLQTVHCPEVVLSGHVTTESLAKTQATSVFTSSYEWQIKNELSMLRAIFSRISRYRTRQKRGRIHDYSTRQQTVQSVA